jgi:hypothetical protein
MTGGSIRRRLRVLQKAYADHPKGCERRFGAQMIAHRPADDPAAVEVHDGGQVEPALVGFDVGDVSKPDPVRGRCGKVAIEQIGRDRQVVPAVGGSHPAWPRHDGANAAVCSRPAPRSSTHRRGTESRNPSSLAIEPTERPLEATDPPLAVSETLAQPDTTHLCASPCWHPGGNARRSRSILRSR